MKMQTKYNQNGGTPRCFSVDQSNTTELTLLDQVNLFLVDTVFRYSLDTSEQAWAKEIYFVIQGRSPSSLDQCKSELSNIESLITSLIHSAGERLPSRLIFDLLCLRGKIQSYYCCPNMATESFVKALWVARTNQDCRLDWSNNVAGHWSCDIIQVRSSFADKI